MMTGSRRTAGSAISSLASLILAAARECPVQAITVLDAETGARVYP
jgi:ferredoxin